VTPQAKAAIETLQEADAKGLNPEDYDGSRWAGRVSGLGAANQPPTESAAAEFDLALTVSVMRYISDLHFGRANPGLFHTRFGVADEQLDLPAFLRQRLLQANDVKAALEEIEPPYQGYRRTERALQQYIAMARDDPGALLPVTKKPIEPNGSYAAAAQLASRLRQLGDLPRDGSMPLDSSTYAGPLVEAVKRFQARHGLDADGRLGKATVEQLNTPLSDRVRQLQFSLERWRWVPHSFP